MRTFIPRENEPILHKSSYSAWQELPEDTEEMEDKDQRIYRGYCKQAEILSAAIKAVIQRALHERVSVIVEGVHFHPSIIKKIIDPGDALVVPVMLAVLKRKALESRIKGRSTKVPQRRARRYLEHFESIWKLQTFLLSEADAADVPIISNLDREDVFREIMLHTIDRLAEDFDKKPDQVFN
jgi:2-phosphoglycerate kinase